MTNYALIAARKQVKKSQAEIADELGVTKSTLNQWEQEKTFPHKYHRRKLCHLFSKTEQELGLLLNGEEQRLALTPFDSFIPSLPDFPLVGRDRELTRLTSLLINVA